MRFYLSSFMLGDKKDELFDLAPINKRIGFIPNACDYTKVDRVRKDKVDAENMRELNKLGFMVEYLDLKEYFGKKDELMKVIQKLGGVFVRGGNTFILRQAMKLSRFDEIFNELLKRDDFLYAGYSAGICVLAKDFRALQIVDDPAEMPYEGITQPIMEGLGFLDKIILPHYKSDHPESDAIDKQVAYCKDHGIPFETLSDGEVIIIK